MDRTGTKPVVVDFTGSYTLLLPIFVYFMVRAGYNGFIPNFFSGVVVETGIYKKLTIMTIEQKSINTIRFLAIDAIELANSGHPGAPMALAPAAYVLWMKHMRFNPRNPNWFNRDRFVLSNGHASMLQYAMLHLAGYDLSLDELKHFRELDSKTPGHPEHGLTPGVETTTGPLGQGFATAVGMAMAEAHLGAIFNKKDEVLVDHYTYVFCGDGDLMEGISHEAASLAGHHGLGKLIVLYDNNHITIEGSTSLAYSDDVAKRFEAYHWNVDDIGEVANDIDAISKAYDRAKAVKDKPTLIMLRSHIGYGSPNRVDTSLVHGSPLGKEEVALTRKFLEWPEETFLVPDDVKRSMGAVVGRGEGYEKDWKDRFAAYQQKNPDQAKLFEQYLAQQLPAGWADQLPVYTPDKGQRATRTVTSDVMKAVAEKLPWVVGGSADLGESTSTLIEGSGYFSKTAYQNRNIDYGIREIGMCAIATGLTVHGGIRPYCATYFCFTDYAKPAMRIAAVMKQPVIYVMTHDSIGLGQDGKTHQPVEQLATFRAMPDIITLRPGDANEAVVAWRIALERNAGPTLLVLSRQKLPVFDRTQVESADGVVKGGYILVKEKGESGPDVILIATGSEVHLAVEAQKTLQDQGIKARVVSLPSFELFRKQPKAYRDSVLPPAVTKRLAIEAAAPLGWHEWVGSEGVILGMREFGESAPDKDLFKHFGFTAEAIVGEVKKMG